MAKLEAQCHEQEKSLGLLENWFWTKKSKCCWTVQSQEVVPFDGQTHKGKAFTASSWEEKHAKEMTGEEDRKEMRLHKSIPEQEYLKWGSFWSLFLWKEIDRLWTVLFFFVNPTTISLILKEFLSSIVKGVFRLLMLRGSLSDKDVLNALCWVNRVQESLRFVRVSLSWSSQRLSLPWYVSVSHFSWLHGQRNEGLFSRQKEDMRERRWQSWGESQRESSWKPFCEEHALDDNRRRKRLDDTLPMKGKGHGSEMDH